MNPEFDLWLNRMKTAALARAGKRSQFLLREVLNGHALVTDGERRAAHYIALSYRIQEWLDEGMNYRVYSTTRDADDFYRLARKDRGNSRFMAIRQRT